MTIFLTVEREVEVTFHHEPASRGARDSLGGIPGAGPPIEPDTDELLEVETAHLDGKEIELTESEKEQAINAARKKIEP